MAQAMTEGLTIPQSRLTPCQPPLHKGAFGCGGINGHIKPPYPPRKAADAARADVGIGPYTPHSIFRPNRRSGISRPPGRAAGVPPPSAGGGSDSIVGAAISRPLGRAAGGLSPSAGGQRFHRRGAHCASVWPRYQSASVKRSGPRLPCVSNVINLSRIKCAFCFDKILQSYVSSYEVTNVLLGSDRLPS